MSTGPDHAAKTFEKFVAAINSHNVEALFADNKPVYEILAPDALEIKQSRRS
jgi:hypothetical protein